MFPLLWFTECRVLPTGRAAAALYTFSPGQPQNEGVFPGRQFVALPNHSKRSVQCYSQHRLLLSGTLRKCPRTILFGADIFDEELTPCAWS